MGVGALGRPAERDPAAAELRLVEHVEGVTTAARLMDTAGFAVAADLATLVPARRLKPGSTIATRGSGATSLALRLVAEAVRGGSFLAVIAPATFNLAACVDVEIPLRRVVQFVLGPARESNWAQQIAAVIEGFDLVVFVDPTPIPAGVARRLVARNRERGSVLVRVGESRWGDEDDLVFDLQGSKWHGLGEGHGHLRSRQVTVVASGRRHPGSARRHHLTLVGPSPDPVEEPQGQPTEPQQRYAGSDIDRILAAEAAPPPGVQGTGA